eukprot:Gregarina_sp_Poly_1__10608@NODE_792_length_6267_cov_148_487258_g580_i0_p5_GENE_NODE_792_length_6267_cov_148_487258_g580_i0NODE_792_length_6267_cov_148_487258_g580_i0_p5_ORF_typecomplete_len187_score37_45Rubella_Capsid/PF05750_11/0_043_NODE_792_length_6267_cov_148_487258_g580_i069629
MADQEYDRAKAEAMEMTSLKMAARFNLHSRSKAPPLTRVQFRKETKRLKPATLLPDKPESSIQQDEQEESSSDDNLGPSSDMIQASRKRRQDRLDSSLKSTFHRSPAEKEEQKCPELDKQRADLEEMELEAAKHQLAKKRRVLTVKKIEKEIEVKEEGLRERAAGLEDPIFISQTRTQYLDRLARR